MIGKNEITLHAALEAQKALRHAANLGEESFPLEAFVGMVSDEIEQLRILGRSDEQIASIIRNSSSVQITAAEIAAHYAPPERRGHPPK